MNLKSIILLTAITQSISTVSFATGRMTCDSGDRNTWQTQAQLQSVIQSKGWKVRKIKEDGGCYEVYGTTPEGKRVEAYFDPVTLEKLLVAQRGKILFEKN